MININTSALLIIDMQEKLVKAANGSSEIVNNMKKLADTAKILNIPTIVTEQYPKGLGKTVETLEINNNETITIEKTAFSALLESEFAEEIQSLNRKQIIIGGIETHICVLQTAADLISEGYEVYVVKDACVSRTSFNHETGLELLKQYGAKITSTEIVLFELLKTSKHPNFKEIQALIK